MGRPVSILLILIYLLVNIAQGDIDVSPFGFDHGTYIEITIRSGCDDAWINLDGNNKSAKTPVEIKVFNPGNHTFKLIVDDLTYCEKDIKICSTYRCIDFDMDTCDYEITEG